MTLTRNINATITTAFTAIGSGIFPIDMLRYDECYPVTSMDANAIAESIDQDTRYNEVRRIRLRGSMRFGPTVRRWESFGFTIEDIREER